MLLLALYSGTLTSWYRYMFMTFPLFVGPAIYLSENGNLRFWEHAHDDLLEFPIEFGVVGLVPLVFILSCAGWQLVRRRFWRNALPLCLVVACTLAMCHSWLDFVFQNPAILLTWSVLLVAAVRWLALEQPGTHRLDTRFSRSDLSPANHENRAIRSTQNPAALVAFPRRPQRLSP